MAFVIHSKLYSIWVFKFEDYFDFFSNCKLNYWAFRPYKSVRWLHIVIIHTTNKKFFAENNACPINANVVANWMVTVNSPLF